MKRSIFMAGAFLTIQAFTGVQAAHADTRRADPGFVYVDVNGDGLYSSSDGDIGQGSTPSVNLNTLILNDGNFSTQRSEGNYHAPCYNASLVIPASQTITTTKSLHLQAGLHLLVYGTLNVPSVSLQACSNVDMTLSNVNFNSSMSICAGYDAILTGSTATGGITGSQIDVQASHNIQSGQANNTVTSYFASESIDWYAGRSASLDGTSLFTLSPPSAYHCGYSQNGISIEAYRNLSAVNQTSLFSFADVSVTADCGNASLLNGSVIGDSIEVDAGTNTSITGTALHSTNETVIQACGSVTGNTLFTNLIAGRLNINGKCGIDMSNAGLLVMQSTLSLSSCSGDVTLTNAALGAVGGVSAYAGSDIFASGVTIHGDNSIQMQANYGVVQISNSTMSAFTYNSTNTVISLAARGDIIANQVNLTGSNPPIQVKQIKMQSSCGNISAQNADLEAVGTPGSLLFTAGGGTINVTGTHLVGAQTFGPSYVHVIGLMP